MGYDPFVLVVPRALVAPVNHRLAIRTRADPLDLDADILLDELNVLARGLRQVVVRLGVGGGLLPAGQLFVDDLDSLEQLETGWERLELLARLRVLVADGDLDVLESIENVELGQVDGLWRVLVNCPQEHSGEGRESQGKRTV